MAETKNLRAIVFHSYTLDSDLRKELKADDAVIKDVYFGRREQVQSLPFPIGLNVIVELENSRESASITYTDMADIRLLMDQFGADRMEYINGKQVTAYRNQYNALVGLSAREE